VLFGLLLVSTEVLALFGLALLLALGTMMVVGYGIAYRSLGLRLAMDPAAEKPLHSTLCGGAVAESAFCVPVIGQLLSLGVLFRGLGAVVITVLTRQSKVQETEPAAPATPPPTEP